MNLHYPKMKATIYLTYQGVNKFNLDSLLRDAQDKKIASENKTAESPTTIGNDKARTGQAYDN